MLHSTASLELIKHELRINAMVLSRNRHGSMAMTFRSRIRLLGDIYREMIRDNNRELEKMMASME